MRAGTNSRRWSTCCSPSSMIATRPPSCAPATSISTSSAIALIEYLDNELSPIVSKSARDAQPTNSFQRVVQRAIVHVQTSGREEVTGANVLVGIFSERESHAAYFLHEQDMTRFDAVQYIAHGIAKRPGMSEPRPVRGADEESRDARATTPRSPATRSPPIASTSTRRPATARSIR